jgi:hypothetical protein
VTFVLRKVVRNRWHKHAYNPEFGWLANGEISADPLRDLGTSKGVLSVYIIDDPSNIVTLNRVTAGMACTTESLSNFEYVLFSLDAIAQAGLRLHETLGDTPDSYVNDLHRDIIEITARKLVDLLHIVWDDVTPIRINEKDVLKHILAGVSSKYIEPSKIRITSTKLRQALDDL